MSPTDQFGFLESGIVIPDSMLSCNFTLNPRDTCDDHPTCTFFVSEGHGTREKCAWLAARPENQTALCQDGQEARIACPETCGLCRDECEDTENTMIAVDGVFRSCYWLSLRPAKQADVCLPENAAWTECAETCGNCPRKTLSPTVTPPLQAAGAALADIELIQSAALPSTSLQDCDFTEKEFDKCDDYGCQFTIADGEKQKCEWLRNREEMKKMYCVEGEEAFIVCPETCGSCYDFCMDDALATIEIAGIQRDCEWLSLRPRFQKQVCSWGSEAAIACPESCDLCEEPVAQQDTYVRLSVMPSRAPEGEET